MKHTKQLKVVILVIFVIVAGVAYSAGFHKNGSQASLEQPTFISEVSDKNAEDGDFQSASPILEGAIVKESIFVHVCGAVKAPGVYELAYDARIYDAVDMAGGFTNKAARDSMNLALPLSDGQQIYIPNKKEAKDSKTVYAEIGSPQEKNGNGIGDPAGDLVNINTANKEALMTLTGIGESKAQSILRYREENGGFQSIEDIMKITGIKEGVFNKIKDRITV